MEGRKRQIIVDTEGNLHQVLVHGANVHEGGAVLAERVLSYERGAKHIVVDLGYGGELERMLNGMGQVKVCFTRKVAGKFVHQARRCVVERTFAWLNWSRRLCKNFGLHICRKYAQASGYYTYPLNNSIETVSKRLSQ